MSVEAQRQEKLDTTEERDFRKEMLLGKYIAKVLYRWDNGKFKNKYLRKLERSWAKLKGRDKTRWGDNSSSGSRNLEGELISELQSLKRSFF